MKPIEFNSLGFKALSWSTPDSVEEYNAKSGRPGNAALEDATDTIMYRSGSPVFRDRFLHGDASLSLVGVDTQTGIPRNSEVKASKTEGGAGVEIWTESEAVYWNRVVQALIDTKKYATREEVLAAFTPFAQSVLDTVPFDNAVREPSVKGPKTANKEYLAIATQAIEKGLGDKLAAKLSKMLGHAVAATPEGIALGIKEDITNESKRRMDKMRELAVA